ncbi:hypothetical protein C8R47DRAFT_1141764 [Mycena vitilis]|nr:hypothetical protein C8R47DRAFT_1141764 [Mycena vitilis]
MSDSSPPSPIMLDSIANYVELAALVVPQRKLGVKEKLRAALPFLPMPLSLGWDADDEAHRDSAVPGLLFSDIKSGATRHVTAPWMHALYKQIQLTQEPGTLLLHLHEAGYTARFHWPHALIFGTFLLQISVIHFAMSHGQRREGLLLLAGLLIRIGDGVYTWAFPKYRPPRTEDRSAEPRYSALHTGMTTNHILVLTHRFDSGYLGECVVLEDSAAPLPRKPTASGKSEILYSSGLTLWVFPGLCGSMKVRGLLWVSLKVSGGLWIWWLFSQTRVYEMISHAV